jgi:hypothetical protein
MTAVPVIVSKKGGHLMREIFDAIPATPQVISGADFARCSGFTG